MTAGKRGVTVAKGLQADRAPGSFQEITGPLHCQRLSESGEEGVRRILGRVTHQSEEGVNRPLRERVIGERCGVARKSQECTKLSRGARPRASALVLRAKKCSEAAGR